MEQYRFHLEKYHRGSKKDCPACGKRRCFVHYVDDKGEISFPNNVGRCDHEDSCGYHYTPKEFFDDNPMYKEKLYDNSYTTPFVPIKAKPIEQKPISYIDGEMVTQSLTHYEINPLYKYLCGVFGREDTHKLFKLYNIGTSKLWEGSTVFWQKDAEGKYRTGKIMRYDAKTGHRVKDSFPAVTWAHSAIKITDFNLKQCFFGEHLLTLHPNATVMIVESEKTAIICCHFMPEYVWIATGGKNGCFNEETIQVLKGREVALFPDLGAYEGWSSKIPMLREVCYKVNISSILEDNASEEQHHMGLDLADFLLMEPTPQMIFQRLIERSPAVRLLSETFDLEVIGIS